MAWGFYGRSKELQELQDILARRRWFFVRITGRRRIGKTALVQQALARTGHGQMFYVQIPDSAPAGVLSTFRDAMDTFELSKEEFARPDSLLALARTVEQLVRAGYFVALDEFQYFSRKHLWEFTSHLQAVVDQLSADAGSVPGGLIVLGSLHAELVALLEDRTAPLYNRTTDQLELKHLDIASVLDILDAHSSRNPSRLLFLWNLFEGVPKFYRDAYEQGVLDEDRRTLLDRMFFRSSSPLRTEADNWFLSELRGRYDVVLKFVARNPGCSNGDIDAYVREVSPGTAEQVGGYLKILIDRYQMLERRQPIFSKPTSRNGRYYIHDNFLRCWLAALHGSVSAIHFRPESVLIEQSDDRLIELEGHGLERLVAQLYEERSRLGVGDFALTERIEGYWDRKDTEIDLVALNASDQVVRFGTCKRSPERLPQSLSKLRLDVERFLNAHRRYRNWRRELVAIAPELTGSDRASIGGLGAIPQDLDELTSEL
ncbi:MAG: ATP-binding protein [Candidatus Eisenbacteria bacterium]|uniref:ATP-binding protein n=1 Tax=Eiseniibacteriota bacterium TaxID=2212470 RepID=A0A956SFL3_UNCEI|nr:ATP-binding protein [Candidatus Eisenbacteria bacterium]